MRTRVTAFLSVLVLLLGVSAASAHDTFIMPDAFRVAPGQTVVVGFHSSDAFPDSSAVMRRLQDPSARSASGVLRIENVREDGKRLAGSFVVPGAGHIILSAVNGAAVEAMKRDEFLEYLTEEGLTGAIAAHERSGKGNAEARERYTMYAKSILLSGAPSEAYRAVVGHPIEIVPDKDPYALKPGEPLPVRVLLGRPSGRQSPRQGRVDCSERRAARCGPDRCERPARGADVVRQVAPAHNRHGATAERRERRVGEPLGDVDVRDSLGCGRGSFAVKMRPKSGKPAKPVLPPIRPRRIITAPGGCFQASRVLA